MRNEHWQRALDVQVDYWKWCNTDLGMMYNYAFFMDVLESATEGDPEYLTKERLHSPSSQIAMHFKQTLYQADTMFVTSDMLHLLMQAAQDLPEDVLFDEKELITRHAFCLFEEPIMGIDAREREIAISGIAWDLITGNIISPKDGEIVDRDKFIIVYFLVDPQDQNDDYNPEFRQTMIDKGVPIPPLTVQHFYPARIGYPVPFGIKDKIPGTYLITDTLRLFVAMQLLARQKIGVPMQLRPDRATRRRVQREFDPNERLITLITLRRKSVKHDNEEPGKVEWSRRWAVQGHWRNQYYAKTNSHNWIYIHEYIKGPEDKPFRPPDHRIFDFRR